MTISTKITRGNLAKKLHIHPETLRFYESQKLIKKPTRLYNNYRLYNDEDITRLKFILMAKQQGFSLKEIKELLSLSLSATSDRQKVRMIASQKSQLIHNKILQMTKIKETLDHLILLCQNSKAENPCPILESLYQ